MRQHGNCLSRFSCSDWPLAVPKLLPLYHLDHLASVNQPGEALSGHFTLDLALEQFIPPTEEEVTGN